MHKKNVQKIQKQVQTLRAKENFHVTGTTPKQYPDIIYGFAMVKKGAALANCELGHMPVHVKEAISLWRNSKQILGRNLIFRFYFLALKTDFFWSKKVNKKM